MPKQKRSSSGTRPRPSSALRGHPRPVHPAISSPWHIRRSRGLQILELARFAEFSWLAHGFSTRPKGVSQLESESVLNLGFMEWDDPENVRENRRRFQSSLEAADLRLAPLKQIHSDVVHLFAQSSVDPCKGDASASKQPGILLAIQTADCVPILLVDPKKRAVAAVHAGWRGTLARIAQKTIGRMQQEFDSRPSDLLAAIGPSIGPCCYEVAADFVAKFTAQFADAPEYFDEPLSGDEPNPLQWLNMKPPGHQPPPKSVRLDLRKANRSQLLLAGLRAQDIFTSDLCTSCRPDLLFSYRREGPLTGRLIAAIGIRA